MKFSSEVPPYFSDTALIEYLSRRFTYLPSEDWRKHVMAGRVLVNDNFVSPDTPVCRGDRVTYKPLPFTEPAANLAYSIIYEDEWFVGVNKPPDLLVHRAGKAFTHNLVYQLRTSSENLREVTVVNRLDKDTSGIVLAAKTKDAAARIAGQFAGQKVYKEYRALVYSSPETVPMTIDSPIGKEPSKTARPEYCIDTHGRRAVTAIVAAERVGAEHSMLTVVPRTGRTHQIRVHLQSIGCPIAGDRVYGPEHGQNIAAEINRQALHCAQIRFLHPGTKQVCIIQAPLADDIEKARAMCARNVR
ncbi:MAG: RluA family pseudouridine synthase [Chitinivibrionales bacterium]|nr:RluA family pseudouridine synthase [Chitinivibrionales bacterium]